MTFRRPIDDQEHTMYGPGTAPPQPRPAGRGAVIALRVIFTALPVLSIGLLAWGSMLRLALVRKRPVDWVLLVLSAAIAVVALSLFAISQDDNSWQANTGGTMLVVTLICTPVYFLVMDIRQGGTVLVVRPGGPGYAHPGPYPLPAAVAPGPIPAAPGAPTMWRPPYGYGQPQAAPIAVPRPAPAPAPTPAAPKAPPAPAPGPAPRLHQVRAELDELSDYLRKEEGR
jgi:hypothetical protein